MSNGVHATQDVVYTDAEVLVDRPGKTAEAILIRDGASPRSARMRTS